MVKENKRGQIAIFVILAILIVGILIILFVPEVQKVFISKPLDVEVEECLEDSVSEVIPLVMKTGGSINPDLYYRYEGMELDYLCYTNEFYKTCVMQKPLLKQNIEDEINTITAAQTKRCLEDLKESLERKGYRIEATGSEDIDINFVPGKAIISADLEITATKEDETRTFAKINGEVLTKAYKLIMIASSISNYEARYGDSEPESYMNFYPDIKVEKKKQSTGTTIYLLTDRDSELELNFASRSVAWPPGYGF